MHALLMKQGVVVVKSFHHGFEESAVEGKRLGVRPHKDYNLEKNMHSKGFEPLRIAPIRPERTTLTTRSQMRIINCVM